MKLHNGEIDANVLGKDEYLRRLNENSFLELLTCFVPEYCVLKQTLNPKDYLEIQPRALVQSVIDESERDIQFARKHFEKNTIPGRGRKTIAHAMRMLAVSMEIARTSRVQSVYAYFRDAVRTLQDENEDWSHWLREYMPRIRELQYASRLALYPSSFMQVTYMQGTTATTRTIKIVSLCKHNRTCKRMRQHCDYD